MAQQGRHYSGMGTPTGIPASEIMAVIRGLSGETPPSPGETAQAVRIVQQIDQAVMQAHRDMTARRRDTRGGRTHE